jgi:non-canonical (house-cleaning) NTP pyrophosphatase
LLTDGAVGRTEYYEQTVCLALIPHKNPELYFASA